jgi:glycosyltransferase involved in cell wall biosynthesis
MNIVWFSWKDINHPQAGGAENISWHLMKNLVENGHSVHLITAQYPAAKKNDSIDGIPISRIGNRVNVYIKARSLYRKNLHTWADMIVDEMNTIPFGAAFYSKQKKHVLLTYQLARAVWFYQLPLPLSVIGYLMEPIYLYLLSRKYTCVLTESKSTKNDLMKYGFGAKSVHIFHVGTELTPVASLAPKKDLNKVLILGAMRPMKRTLDAVKGFEIARDINPSLILTIAGDNTGSYANKVMDYVKQSRHSEAISVLGRVGASERIQLMQQASVILVTSIKEGWGLIVTEANTQGTPAIAYDCDGLRDSVTDNITGKLVTSGDTSALGKAIVEMLGNPSSYEKIRFAAWNSSKEYTFKAGYRDFERHTGL